MNIRILAASALTIAAMAGVAIAEPSNGNWEKCPGGFDAATSKCLSRDKFDGAFPNSQSRTNEGSAVADPLANQGGEIQ